METKFQTSFIPKKPLVSDQRIVAVRTGTSILMVIATLLFLISVAGAVFSVVWINVLNKDQENYRKQLAGMESKFPIADIENLRKFNKKIDISKQLLKNHLAVEEIFSILSQLTIEDVRFNSFSFSAPTKEGEGVVVTLGGVARNFYAIAFQSDVFGTSDKYGKNKVLKNPVISSVAEQENGTINFSFTAVLNTDDLKFAKTMTVDDTNEDTTVASSTTP
jgi:hypothetical protein